MMTRPTEGVATDGAHSTKGALTRFRAVDLKTGQELYNYPIGNQTINIGEFLGAIEALKYIIRHNYTPRVIYCDSRTAIAWIRDKRTASRKRYAPLLKAELFLDIMAAEVETIKVIHWEKDLWGETPADYDEK